MEELRLVNDYGEALVLQSGDIVYDIRELLNRSRYNFCIAVQGNRQVRRIALVIHNTDEPCLVLHTHNGLLELSVSDHTVSDDDNVVKYDSVVGIVQRCQTVRQPSYGVRLPEPALC